MISKAILHKFLLVWCIAMLPSAASAQGWLWGRGNTGKSIEGWTVATDPFGNVYGGGITGGNTPVIFGSITVPFTGTGEECIIVKYDADGNVLWANGTQNGDAYLLGLACDNNGNVYMFGSVQSSSLQIGSFTITNSISPKLQYFLAKYDPSGNVLWVKNEGNTKATYWYYCTDEVVTDKAGNVYITTSFDLPAITIGTYTLTNTDPSGSTDDILLAKYDPSGNVVWAKSVGGINNDDVSGITVTQAGDIYISGVFASPTIAFGPSAITNSTGYMNAFIARYNAAGIAVWANSSGGNGGVSTAGVVSDLSNNVYLTGAFNGNSISFSGTTITNPTPGKSVIYLVKFDQTNNVSWDKTILSDSTVYCIAISQCGVVWVSGPLPDSINISGNILHAPINSIDPVFFAGYTSNGTYAGSSALQSGGDDRNNIACDPFGNLYTCGDYLVGLGVHAFIVGKDTLAAALGGQEYLYVAKYLYINAGSQNFIHLGINYCLGTGITIDAPAGYSNYEWYDGTNGSTHSISDTGIYWVIGFDSCVSLSLDTFIVSSSCDCGTSLFVPNAFTPNGDGQDDVFYPRSGGGIALIKSFRVYNRWGELLFERSNIMPNDASNAWNGTYQGDKPLPDVYVWVVDALCDNGKTINKKGSITVIR